ncbi:MAG: diacylglycerol/lipid kinase family protein [Anaerovoracaceae bacterium]
MKHIFIVNPMAGNGQGEKWMNKISEASVKTGVPVEIYKTRFVGDGENQVRQICENRNEKKIRFYACGGDGTLNEVVNGIMAAAKNYKNNQISNKEAVKRAIDKVTKIDKKITNETIVKLKKISKAIKDIKVNNELSKYEVSCLPIGSGNDFVRNFVDAGDFYNVEALIIGKAEKIDLINYKGIVNDKFVDRYAINMFNIGFDAYVAEKMIEFKKWPLIKGSGPYNLSLAYHFFLKKGDNLRVLIDGEEKYNGKLFFVSIANGIYLGGGIKGAPVALVDDGIMEINIVRNITRMQFLKLAPSYMNGTHMSMKGIEKIITYERGKKLEIIPNKGEMKLGVDGEIYDAKALKFEVIHEALKFVQPATAELK